MEASGKGKGPAGDAQASPAGPRPADPGVRVKKSRDRLRKWGEISFFTGPALLLFVFFVILPVALAAYYSFFKWNGIEELDTFVGLDNYRRAFADPDFIGAIRNNLFVVAMSLLIQLPIALVVALVLNRRFRGRSAMRMIIFAPYIFSEVIAAVLWLMILQPRGPLDAVMENLGLEHLRQLWLADLDVVMWTVFFVISWKYIGLAIILFLAGLSGVPKELQEAAAIDGASWWRTQWQINVPLIAPTIRIWMFLSIIGSIHIRHGVGADPRRAGRGVVDHRHLHVPVRILPARLGLRLSSRRDHVPLVARDRARLHGDHPASRQYRRRPKGEVNHGYQVFVSVGPRHGQQRCARVSMPHKLSSITVGLAGVALTLGPIIYLFMGGLFTQQQFAESPTSLPNPAMWENYWGIISEPLFWRQLLNSTIVALATTTGVVVMGTMAAYPLARYRFKGKEALFVVFTTGLMSPLTVAALPLYLLLGDMGIKGLWGLVIPQIAFALPVTVIIMRPFIKALPDDLLRRPRSWTASRA